MDPPTVTPTTAAATANAAAAAAAASVQHVNKKSSDELLRKFADSGDEAPAKKQVLRVSKRRKRSQKNGEGDQCESPLHGSSLVERRSLLPAGTKSKALLRQLGIHGRASHLRARDIRNKSLFIFAEISNFADYPKKFPTSYTLHIRVNQSDNGACSPICWANKKAAVVHVTLTINHHTQQPSDVIYGVINQMPSVATTSSIAAVPLP